MITMQLYKRFEGLTTVMRCIVLPNYGYIGGNANMANCTGVLISPDFFFVTSGPLYMLHCCPYFIFRGFQNGSRLTKRKHRPKMYTPVLVYASLTSDVQSLLRRTGLGLHLFVYDGW